jgi:hypothetical protein
MTAAGDINHVEVVLVDQPIEVNVDEVQSRRRSPATEQSRLWGGVPGEVGEAPKHALRASAA